MQNSHKNKEKEPVQSYLIETFQSNTTMQSLTEHLDNKKL